MIINLSPYEKDRIVPQAFGQTEMGRDLLAEDYILKQVTASLIYPESQLGKEFWKKVYTQAQAKYGTTNIPINTFNKVWIVPEKAVVYENGGVAFVLENHLKVMLEQDYLSMQKHNIPPSLVKLNSPLFYKEGLGEFRGSSNNINTLGSQIVREIVIPALTKEVNEGKNFSQLRQVFYSLILATWYKKKIKDSILNKVYSNRNKIQGLVIPGASNVIPAKAGPHTGHSQELGIQNVEYIYQQYLKAFKKGVFNYIQEEPDQMTGQTIPRKYFSGGVLAEEPPEKIVTGITPREIAGLAIYNADIELRMSRAMKAETGESPKTTSQRAVPGIGTSADDAMLTTQERKAEFLRKREQRDRTLSVEKFKKVEAEIRNEFDRYLSHVPQTSIDEQDLQKRLWEQLVGRIDNIKQGEVQQLAAYIVELSRSRREAFASLETFRKALDPLPISSDIKRLSTLPFILISVFPPNVQYERQVEHRAEKVRAWAIRQPVTAGQRTILIDNLNQEGYLEGNQLMAISFYDAVPSKTTEQLENLIYSIFDNMASGSFNDFDRITLNLLAIDDPKLRPIALTALVLLLDNPSSNVRTFAFTILGNILSKLPSNYFTAGIDEIRFLARNRPVLAAQGVVTLIASPLGDKNAGVLFNVLEKLARESSQEEIKDDFILVLQMRPELVSGPTLAFLTSIHGQSEPLIVGALASIRSDMTIANRIRDKIELSSEKLLLVANEASTGPITRRLAQYAFIRQSLTYSQRITHTLDSPIQTTLDRVMAIRMSSEIIRALLKYADENTGLRARTNNRFPLQLAETIFDHLNESKTVGEFQSQLRRYEEFHMMRVANWPGDIREELLHNRVLLQDNQLSEDPRPRDFYIIARGDWNGALMNRALIKSLIQAKHLVLYEEVESPDQFRVVIEKFASLNTGHPHLAVAHIFPFHSSAQSGTLGRTMAQAEMLNVSYAEKLKEQRLYEGLLPEGTVILAGCSPAAREDVFDTNAKNLANMFDQAYNGRKVAASTEEISYGLFNTRTKKFNFFDDKRNLVGLWSNDEEELGELDSYYKGADLELEASKGLILKVGQGRYIISDELWGTLNYIQTRSQEMHDLFRQAKDDGQRERVATIVLERFERQKQNPIVIDFNKEQEISARKFLIDDFSLSPDQIDQLLLEGNILIPNSMAIKLSEHEREQLWARLEHQRLLALMNSERMQRQMKHLIDITQGLKDLYMQIIQSSASIRIEPGQDANAFGPITTPINLKEWFMRKMEPWYGTNVTFHDFWALAADKGRFESVYDKDAFGETLYEPQHLVQILIDRVLRSPHSRVFDERVTSALAMDERHRKIASAYVRNDVETMRALPASSAMLSNQPRLSLLMESSILDQGIKGAAPMRFTLPSINKMPGGIDLNPAQMSVQVKKQGEDFKFDFNGTEIDAAQVTGATFTIHAMTPVTDLPAELGLNQGLSFLTVK